MNTDYQNIQDCSSKLAKNIVELASNIGNLSYEFKSELYIALKDEFQKEMIDSSFPPEVFEEFVSTSSTLASRDVLEMSERGYLNYDKKSEVFLSKFSDHMNALIKEETKRKPEIKKPIEAKQTTTVEPFISIPKIDSFYDQLMKEINETYNNHTYTATLILCRKLIENLLIDLLRKKYGDKSKEAVAIYFNIDEGRFHDFTYLLKNFEDRKDDFKIDKELVEDFLLLVKPFRKGANSKTHSIIFFVHKKEELVGYHIPRMVDLLLRLISNIR